ncbi:MAG: hypothetical protein IPG01_19440 [Chitinophagaceae bacterium]|nr:hypothetical protein [Chitinophagaceae bacterium]
MRDRALDHLRTCLAANGRADVALNHIPKFYAVERKIKQLQLSCAQAVEIRKQKSLPVIVAL